MKVKVWQVFGMKRKWYFGNFDEAIKWRKNRPNTFLAEITIDTDRFETEAELYAHLLNRIGYSVEVKTLELPEMMRNSNE